jgi:outer membrane protein assembly factor BamD
MRIAPLLFLLSVVLASCSDFNRALKSTDLEYKVETAEKYYAAGSWDRAIPLLEELIVLTRGSARGERMNYLHAKAHFGMKDYILGGYYLSNFVRTFPTSSYAEECAFLSAYCFYKNSPAFELDQTDTRQAIDQMQLFMVRYPTTNLKDSCNTLIDRMRGKLETKAYMAGAQYHRMRQYQAAGVSLRNFVRDWPNSKYREVAMFSILEADHFLAINSVESKRAERLDQAITSYLNFVDAFPKSPMLADAESMHKELTDAKARHIEAKKP